MTEAQGTTDFRMDVRVDQVLEEGNYPAKLEKIEKRDGDYGERLYWTFLVKNPDGDDQEIMGFTSTSPSTKGYAYQWASALMGGNIDPVTGWGPEDVVGKQCVVTLDVTEDRQGIERNKITKLKPAGQQRRRRQAEPEPERQDPPENEEDFDDIPF